MKRLELTTEHFDWVADRIRDNVLTEREMGEAFQSAFPGVFKVGIKPLNVTVSVKRSAKDAGYDMPRGKICKQPPVANTNWLDDNPELIFEYQPKVICLSDVHVPSHSRGALELAAKVAEERGISFCVWNGDLFDFAYKGHKGIRDIYAASFLECVQAGIEAIDFMTQAGIRHHLFLQGNHDDKMFRGSDGEQSFTEFLEAKVFPEINLDGVKVSATNRYFAIMRPRAPKPWPFDSPDNFPWIFTHQKNYGKNPLSVAGELGSIEFGNIASGHQHHLSIGRHKSGIMYICDAGTLQNPDLPSYKNARQSRHPKWACGFLTIEDGVPQIHNHI